MNYRHAFHAGNHADVLKHVALLFCLDALKRKDTPFAVLDTHAGRGLYDLTSSEAQRSPEWQGGVSRIWNWPDPPPLIARYREAVAAYNGDTLTAYPGSPLLIADALRADDALHACDLHPEEHALLKRALRNRENAHVHLRDGWQALTALLPPPQKRGLVLIDPPYEKPDELEQTARMLIPALKRFGHGVYIWWRPMKSQSALDAADAEVQTQGARETLRVDLWVNTPALEGKLVGSSLLVINPPFGLEAALREALPALSEWLSAGKCGWRLQS
jgi:23S rRNA (adenine2030-N6)-methyltransferase